MSITMQKELMLSDESDRLGNKKFSRANRPAQQIYRPPGLRQQESPQDLVVERNDFNNSSSPPSPPVSVIKNDIVVSIPHEQHHHHHVSFVEPLGEVQTKPLRAAGSKQPYKKDSRSHTSPLVGLVPKDSEADIPVGTKSNGAFVDETAITITTTTAPTPIVGNSFLRAKPAVKSQNRRSLGAPKVSQPTTVTYNYTNGTTNSSTAVNGGSGMKKNPTTVGNLGFVKQNSPPSVKCGASQLAEITQLLTTLKFMEETEGLKEYVQSGFESESLASQFGCAVLLGPIEQGKPSKLVAKLCGLLVNCPTGKSFHSGLVMGCQQYFDCAATLRQDHFRCWLNFINFLADLYGTLGFTVEGELVQILFRCFDYMLKHCLDSLKIEELESIISCLLNIGYDVERECPLEVAELRNTLRESFITASEPWARKMILLMIELSACGWRLPPEANEYYFHTSQSQNASTPAPNSSVPPNA